MPKVYTGDLTKMFDISGKKAMIFGGAGGFGEAIAAGYAANGCSVCISSRSEEKLKAAKAKIEAAAAPGVKVMYVAGDAGDEEFVKKALAEVTGPDGLGGCDILVNATGHQQEDVVLGDRHRFLREDAPHQHHLSDADLQVLRQLDAVSNNVAGCWR